MPKLKTKSGAKKRFKITGTGKVVYAQQRQAPRHDQAHEQADPQPSRHDVPVQDGRRQREEILPAERLIVPSSTFALKRLGDYRHGSRQTRRHLARQA